MDGARMADWLSRPRVARRHTSMACPACRAYTATVPLAVRPELTERSGPDLRQPVRIAADAQFDFGKRCRGRAGDSALPKRGSLRLLRHRNVSRLLASGVTVPAP